MGKYNATMNFLTGYPPSNAELRRSGKGLDGGNKPGA
jgi:hypothetical protein